MGLALLLGAPAFAGIRCLGQSFHPAKSFVGMVIHGYGFYTVSVIQGGGGVVHEALYKEAGFYIGSLLKVSESFGKGMPDQLKLFSTPVKDLRNYEYRLSGLPVGPVSFYQNPDCK